MKKENLWPLVTFLVLYTGLLFARFFWMLKSQLEPIKELLSNHITDTNKKIEKLSDRFEEQDKHFNDRFNRLYKLLIADKAKK